MLSATLQQPHDVPASLDWRELGFNTPPVNQRDCGSCYAYSIVESIQGQIFKQTGMLIPLSAQQLVDCSTATGNRGCAGGSLRNTLRYLEKSKGLMARTEYPYQAQVRLPFHLSTRAIRYAASRNIACRGWLANRSLARFAECPLNFETPGTFLRLPSFLLFLFFLSLSRSKILALDNSKEDLFWSLIVELIDCTNLSKNYARSLSLSLAFSGGETQERT